MFSTIDTVILLCSSLAMAMAVWAARGCHWLCQCFGLIDLDAFHAAAWRIPLEDVTTTQHKGEVRINRPACKISRDGRTTN
jgi:hypothetical protein